MLLGLAEPTASPPDDGVPPVEPGDCQVEPAHPVVFSFEVCELMGQKGRPLPLVEIGPEIRRHEQPGLAAQRPEHGGNSSRGQPDRRGAFQAKLPGHLVDLGLNVGRRGLKIPQQALEADDPHGCQEPADHGACDNQRQEGEMPGRKPREGDHGVRHIRGGIDLVVSLRDRSLIPLISPVLGERLQAVENRILETLSRAWLSVEFTLRGNRQGQRPRHRRDRQGHLHDRRRHQLEQNDQPEAVNQSGRPTEPRPA